ncbi:extracellular solute-binding protein [Dactylosporangium sp. AC04546]|uniref:extracellular solute-binding protein n=1 Tax=Dactylosporangium sp. AC04546 TaxID=2862460 RepID=UPI001EDEACAE|nr:extracellular solute-binding protein [Dactylosporangium sp. AC04546]WVK81412.1 extracellular solute-binding protein [Dactylosporangium sp. AC04546]
MRRRALIASVLVAALASAGCSEGGGGAAADPKQLTVWIMGDSSAHFEELVKPFTTKTGIAVDAVAIPWDSIDQKLTTAVASGKGPDVLQIGLSKLRTFASSGALMTFDDKTLAGHPNLAADRFLDGVAGKATAVGGNVVSVPWVSDTRVLFYRTDILQAAGITEPPKTWDELRADARTLAARGKGQYGYYIPQWDSALPVIMTWGQGGQVVDGTGKIKFDTPEFGRAVEVYTGLYADKSVPTNADFDQVQGFTSGVAPMLVSGPYLAGAVSAAAPELKGKWSVAPIPTGGTDASLLAGSSLGVWGSTGNRDGALQLLDYLSEPQTQLTWYKLDGQLPTVKQALADSSLTADPLVQVYARQLATARLLPLVPNWDGETGKALLDALNSIVLTGANRDTALKGLYQATSGTSTQ